MKHHHQLTDEIAIADQPTEEDLTRLAEQGFQSVINLRHDGEDQMPMGPAEEADRVEAAGLIYHHVPVSMNEAGPDVVQYFREAMAASPSPTLVHCKLGARAGAFVVMDLAAREGLTGEQALNRARQLGTPLSSQTLADFVRNYADSRRG